MNSFPSSSQVPPCRQGWESQGRGGFLVAGGWRVGFRRVVAGRVKVGLLVLAAPTILVLGRPAKSWRRTWAVVAAAAVVYLRVVAGAMVVAVVVVTVVVKSLGIQSGRCKRRLLLCRPLWGQGKLLGLLGRAGSRGAWTDGCPRLACVPKTVRPLPFTLQAPELLLGTYESGSCMHSVCLLWKSQPARSKGQTARGALTADREDSPKSMNLTCSC